MISFALAHVLAQNLNSELSTILSDPALQGAVVSAYVCKPDGTVLFEHNSATRVMPASNEKLVTTTFAMHTLGPAKRLETHFWKEPEGVMVYAPGDPSLTGAQLREVGQKLGVKSGTSIYVKQAYHQGVPADWEFDDLPNRYAPKIVAFSADRAGFAIECEKGQLLPLPEEYLVDIDRRPYEQGERVTYDPATGHCDIRGVLPDKKTVLDTLAQTAPDRTACAFLGSRRMIPIEHLPFRSPDQVVAGRPLGDVIHDCLVDSDNYYAEQLFLISASSLTPLVPTEPYKGARTQVSAFLKSTGIDPADFHTQDGSGLSRHNLVTTRGLAHLLAWVNKQSWAELYQSYLVTPGQGTLKDRSEAKTFRGKTGTLDMVVALSGYVKNAVGDTVIASVIFNHSTAPTSKQRQLADHFMATLEKSR